MLDTIAIRMTRYLQLITLSKNGHSKAALHTFIFDCAQLSHRSQSEHAQILQTRCEHITQDTFPNTLNLENWPNYRQFRRERTRFKKKQL